MKKRILVISLAVASAVAFPAYAQSVTAVGGQGPNAVAAGTKIELTATITAIDKATRTVTLKGPQGREKTIEAGPEVKNFDQLKVGDQVTVQYVEALVLELKKGGGLVVSRTEDAGAKAAKPGDKPGVAAGRSVTVVGDVIDTNPAAQTITVKGPQRTVEVRIDDAARFKQIAKGDQIQATFVEAAAISVKPAAK